MRSVTQAILAHGRQNFPSRGPNQELTGVLLAIDEPLSRISRTESRGKPFSGLGELCWYLSGSADADFISYYLRPYRECAEDGVIYGAYGPRLFDEHRNGQVKNVIELLRQKPASRRAVIQLFDAADIVCEHKDVPCTCTMQFLIRDDKLDMFTCMRSNDVYRGLPHDVFAFTMIQEIIARTLSVGLGSYKHAVGSIHLYESDRSAAEKFIDEGWQANIIMPSMPEGDPWPQIALLLQAEESIRTGTECYPVYDGALPYWADLIRMLQILHFVKNDDWSAVETLRQQMDSDILIRHPRQST